MVCAIAASRSHPLGGYGVFNLFENRQLGTLNFTARSFRKRHGREYFEGTAFEYTDGTMIVTYGAWVTWVSMSARV